MQTPKIIKGERIILQRFDSTIANAQAIFNAVDANREHLSKVNVAGDNKTPKDSLKYLSNNTVYAIFINNILSGGIHYFDFKKDTKSVEIGYWLIKSSEGNGYISDALKLLENELFKKVNRITLGLNTDNVRSSNVATRNGYRLEGHFLQDHFNTNTKKIVDSLWYAKLKSEWEMSK